MGGPQIKESFFLAGDALPACAATACLFEVGSKRQWMQRQASRVAAELLAVGCRELKGNNLIRPRPVISAPFQRLRGMIPAFKTGIRQVWGRSVRRKGKACRSHTLASIQLVPTRCRVQVIRKFTKRGKFRQRMTSLNALPRWVPNSLRRGGSGATHRQAGPYGQKPIDSLAPIRKCIWRSGSDRRPLRGTDAAPPTKTVADG